MATLVPTYRSVELEQIQYRSTPPHREEATTRSCEETSWEQYDRLSPTSLSLPGIKALLQNPAYSLLLQCFFPAMSKRYHSQGDQMQLYLLLQGTAIQIQDDGLLFFGDEKVGQRFRESVDLYQQLGRPRICEYRVTFQERQAVICVGDRRFLLPNANIQKA